MKAIGMKYMIVTSVTFNIGLEAEEEEKEVEKEFLFHWTILKKIQHICWCYLYELGSHTVE